MRSLHSLLLSVALCGTASSQSPASSDIGPLLGRYCLECHSSAEHKGDLDLESLLDGEGVVRDPESWLLVEEQLAAGGMPPSAAPQPEPAERERLLGFARALLSELAQAEAGDPGPVLLRRLSNAELGYSLRDLTGIASLDPARELPVDGAAGEGFTNVGNALVMSPMLLSKYLAVARETASHAVLLPGGIGFEAGTSRREWTEAALERIRAFHRRYVEGEGHDQVDANGIVVATDGGGRLPLERYLAAALELRERGAPESELAELARQRGLSAKYLRHLVSELAAGPSSPLLDALRARWRTLTPATLGELVTEIRAWQERLFRFEHVSHLGKVGGPTAWQTPVDPIVDHEDFRLPLGALGSTETLQVGFEAVPVLGDEGAAELCWVAPRIQKAGRPDLPLATVEGFAAALRELRRKGCATAASYLRAADELRSAASTDTPATLAARQGLELAELERWLAWLGLAAEEVPLGGHLGEPLREVLGLSFLAGYGGEGLPNALANSSDEAVRVPGLVEGKSVVVHPSPELGVVIAWRAPLALEVAVQATIQDAHGDCGNGVEWMLDVERGSRRWRYGAGVATATSGVASPVIPALRVQPGDRVLLRIAPGGMDHTCDLTRVDLALEALGTAEPRWRLSSEVCEDILAGNPHADALGHPAVWHFCSEPTSAMAAAAEPLPEGSSLAQWLACEQDAQRAELVERVARTLAEEPAAEGAEARLRRQLLAIDGPLCGGWERVERTRLELLAGSGVEEEGLRSDFLQASGRPLVCAIPSELAAGAELVTTARLARPEAAGAVQARLSLATQGSPALRPAAILCGLEPTARERLTAALADFRALFPAALCYAKIVPVDEVVTLVLYHREDEPLRRLLLEEPELAELERLWSELHCVSQDALALVDAYEQLMQYATQDGDPTVFEPLREPIRARAQAFREELVAHEPRQIAAVLELASRAWRRPLATSEEEELRAFYRELRGDDFDHDSALRLLLARVLLSPCFLYHEERPGAGKASTAIDDWELASRLSYFLWSSLPDEELRRLAASGRLHEPDELLRQTQRMLADERVRRLAQEFGCAWLHVQGLDQLDEKSERHFPTFLALRGAMYEEVLRFFVDFFQGDASILSLLDADHVFVNGPLAEHYGIPGVEGEEWRRVEGARSYGRGGVLAFAASLSKQAGASRTSPVLRGDWVCEALLGERLPRPPKDVPRLPEDEAAADLGVRELTERHSSDPRCAGCHARMDPFGFTLERYDGIGRLRELDLGGRALDVRATTRDGAQLDGLDGLRQYLLERRRGDFVHQFCKKLLGYALGRATRLSDLPLLERIEAELAADDYRVGRLIEAIVSSPQFLRIRGRGAGG